MKAKISSFIIVMVAGFFPRHNAVAKPVIPFSNSFYKMEAPGNAAPRKKSLNSATKVKNKARDPLTDTRVGNFGSPFAMVVGSTSYSSTEEDADLESSNGIGACKFKLQYPDENQLGVVAVDPNVIPIGSIVLVMIDGKVFKFIAGDVGGTAVINRTAVKVRAARQGITDSRANAPVFDFYMPDCKQVGGEWTDVVVIPYEGKKPFLQLNESSQNAYLKSEVWATVLTNAMQTPMLVASR